MTALRGRMKEEKMFLSNIGCPGSEMVTESGGLCGRACSLDASGICIEAIGALCIGLNNPVQETPVAA